MLPLVLKKPFTSQQAPEVHCFVIQFPSVQTWFVEQLLDCPLTATKLPSQEEDVPEQN
jgi:hypothetical protein